MHLRYPLTFRATAGVLLSETVIVCALAEPKTAREVQAGIECSYGPAVASLKKQRILDMRTIFAVLLMGLLSGVVAQAGDRPEFYPSSSWSEIFALRNEVLHAPQLKITQWRRIKQWDTGWYVAKGSWVEYFQFSNERTECPIYAIVEPPRTIRLAMTPGAWNCPMPSPFSRYSSEDPYIMSKARWWLEVASQRRQ